MYVRSHDWLYCTSGPESLTLSYCNIIEKFRMADSRAILTQKVCSVFQKHFANLNSGLKDHLPVLVSQLYSRELVSLDIVGKITDTANGIDLTVKCMCVLKEVQERIKNDYLTLEKFCEVLCHQNVGLAHLGEPLRDDFQQLCQGDHSVKPTFHGSYNALSDKTSMFTEPTSESHVEDRISKDSSAFEKFCDVLSHQQVGLEHLGDPMRCDFQQLCSSAKQTFHASYSTPENSSVFQEPASDSNMDVTDCDESKEQTERFVKYDLGSDTEKLFTVVKSFEAPQQAQGDGDSDGTHYGEHVSDQTVPVKESSYQKSAKIIAPYIDLASGCYVTQRSGQDLDHEEKCRIGDMKVSLDKIARKCGDCSKCAKIKAEYESKLRGLEKYYDMKLKDMAESRSTCIQQELDETKHCLTWTLDHQTKEKLKKEEEIKQLNHQIKELEVQTTREIDQLKARSKNEQDKLRSKLSLKEKELHDINQSASHCPVYSNKMRRANFEQKRGLCSEIDSLVKQMFTSKNSDEKNKLCQRIHAKLARFSPLERSRSNSM